MADEGGAACVPTCSKPLSMQGMASVLEEFLHRKSVLEGLPGHEYSRLRNLYEALNTELTNENPVQAKGSGHST